MVRTNVIYIALNCKRTPRIGVAYTNYLASSLDIFIDKTLVLSFSALFTYPSINRKPYYNSSLSLNKSINLTSTNKDATPISNNRVWLIYFKKAFLLN